MKDDVTTIEDLKILADKFRTERDWGKHHTPKNLAVSIAIEAAELMEKFQWDEYKDKDAHHEVKDELADVIIYCLYLAKSNNIDITAAVTEKLERAAKKYPVEIFNAKKDDPATIGKLKRDIGLRVNDRLFINSPSLINSHSSY